MIVFGKLKEEWDEKIMIVDEKVLKIWREKLPKIEHIPIKASEKEKNLATVEKIYEKFLEKEVDRETKVLVVGGGIVLDVGGFACSTYLRGLEFSFVPTTLLAQVDASIGGKNGVNFHGYKNLIGTFTQPKNIYIDVEFLNTLPKKEMLNGIAESIKHAIIGSPRLFELLENKEAVEKKERRFMEELIRESIRVKTSIVEEDERERGVRRKLNLGHTFAHAIEKATGIPHGEAVSIGLNIAGKISVMRGLLKEEEYKRIYSLLKKYTLPTSLKADPLKIIDAIKKDKKRSGEEINFVLIRRIGQVVVEKIKLEEVENLVCDMCEHC